LRQHSRFILLCWILLGATRAYGDVGVVLNESLDTSIARITGSGHSAVYLSRICPESPVKLRLCGPQEQGSVISNYTTLGEDEPFEWNIAPLNMYLYGVANAQDRPLFATEKIKRVLEQEYRERYLAQYCPGPPCTISKKAEWREMVAATSSRSIYIFVVKTTLQQDEELIAKFNSMPNQNHFNAFTRNCANFTRGVIDTYFPHAVHPDYINDFGITSPKAIARSFSRYAHHHPGAEYRVLHFAQLPGTVKRSTVARDGTEQLYRSKKLLIPMILVASHELPVFAASYVLTGRFDPEREFEQHFSPLASNIDYQIKAAKDDNDDSLVETLRAAKLRESEQAGGSPKEWARFREEFNSLIEDAVHEEIIPDRDYVGHVFKEIDGDGIPVIAQNGSLWMDVQRPGQRITKVGLSPDSVAAPGSNPELAYQILLAHADQVLKSPAHSRETVPQFRETWDLLQQVRGQMSSAMAQQKSGAALAARVN
jgi:hypothetical protein